MMELIRSDLFLLTVTIGIYCGCSTLYRRTRFALLHPVLLTFMAMIAFLKIFSIPYEHYRAATEALNFALGMSVVSLGYLLYEQKEQMKGEIVPIISSILTGCIVGIISVVYIAKYMGADRMILTSIAPKSVTIPIAVAVAKPLGGEVSITSVVVFCVGLLGNIIGFWLLNKLRTTDPKAQGLAMGSAAHGVGTARAIEHGAIEGAMSGLAMALMGVATAMILPLVEHYLY